MTRSPDGRPLTWNVAGLLAEDPGASREFDVSDVTIPLDDDPELAGPISGHVRLRRTNRGIIADARLQAGLRTECSRCLPHGSARSTSLSRRSSCPRSTSSTGKPLPADAEPDVARLTDHHEIDLEPLVRDELVLAEPIAPLHSPDCAGLCIECGLPLDEGTHDHPTDDIDPRFEALRGFTAEGDEDPRS